MASAPVAPPDAFKISTPTSHSCSPTSPTSSSSSSFYSPTTPKRPHSHLFMKHDKSRIAWRRYRWHRVSNSKGTSIRLSDYRPPIFQTPSRPSPDILTPVYANPSLTRTSSSGAVRVRSATTSGSVEPIHSASSGMNCHGVLAQPQSALSHTPAPARKHSRPRSGFRLSRQH